jgi:hypothetical protein
MQIKITQPDEDYPLVYVHIPITHNEFDLDYMLTQRRVSLLGKWEKDEDGGYKAPGLREDQHVKPKAPRKTTARRK